MVSVTIVQAKTIRQRLKNVSGSESATFAAPVLNSKTTKRLRRCVTRPRAAYSALTVKS